MSSDPRCRRSLLALLPLLLLLAALGSSPGRAQVVRDGSLGDAPAGLVPAGIDPDGLVATYLITEQLGERPGGGPNLFHSFSSFGIREGETAAFTGPAGIENVVGRVTGGSVSQIEGTLRSTIPGADVFLINPAGVAFGNNAKLDVQGSFHMSTADSVRLADGSRFAANPPAGEVLSVAPPAAFGFLEAGPGRSGAIGLFGIDLTPPGAAEEWTVPPGERVALVSGTSPGGTGLEIVGRGSEDLWAPGGRIDLVAVASGGEVGLDPSGPPPLDGFTALGPVEIENAQILTDAEGAGSIFIRGGEIQLRSTVVRARTTGPLEGGDVDLKARGTLLITEGSRVGAATTSSGAGGETRLDAREIRIDEGGRVTPSGSATGRLGDLLVTAAERIELVEDRAVGGAEQTEVSSGGDPSTRILVRAPEILVSGANLFANGDRELRVEADRVEVANGGHIDGPGGGRIHVRAAERLEVRGHRGDAVSNPLQRSSITTTNLSGEPPGHITIESPQVVVRDGARILTHAFGDDPAGNIRIDAARVEIARSSEISSLTQGSAPSGEIHIRATERVAIEGPDLSGSVEGLANRLTGISSRTQTRDGPGGTIRIETAELEVSRGGIVTTGTLVEGAGGDVHVVADRVAVRAGGVIDSSTALFGEAGSIEIDAAESVAIEGTDSRGRPSRIGSVSLTFGDAGDVGIRTPLLVVDGGAIATTSVGAGQLPVSISLSLSGGAPVPIAILPPTIEGAVLFADRQSADIDFSEHLVGRRDYPDGAAGAIALVVDRLELRGGGLIDSSSFSAASAGQLRAEAAETIIVTGAGSTLRSRPGPGGTGGGIELRAPQVRVAEGGEISIGSGTSSLDVGVFLAAIADILAEIQAVAVGGASGVEIVAELPPLDANTLNDLLAASRANLGPDDDAGSLFIATERLFLDRGTVAAGAERIEGAAGSVAGGNVVIDAASRVSLRDASIDASVRGGTGGELRIRAGRRLELERSTLSAAAEPGSGGNVTIEAEDLVHLDASAITTSVTSGTGGDIVIDPDFVVLQSGSRIVARAGEGQGGSIRIVAGGFLASPDSVVDASADVGIDGQVEIESPDVDLSGQLAALPVSFQDAAALLREPCAARGGGAASSFVAGGREGTPLALDGYLIASPPREAGVGLARAPRPPDFDRPLRRDHVAVIESWVGSGFEALPRGITSACRL
jgi:filamentous hemagglutinin family protein